LPQEGGGGFRTDEWRVILLPYQYPATEAQQLFLDDHPTRDLTVLCRAIVPVKAGAGHRLSPGK
jgi:hypothetical protein